MRMPCRFLQALHDFSLEFQHHILGSIGADHTAEAEFQQVARMFLRLRCELLRGRFDVAHARESKGREVACVGVRAVKVKAPMVHDHEMRLDRLVLRRGILGALVIEFDDFAFLDRAVQDVENLELLRARWRVVGETEMHRLRPGIPIFRPCKNPEHPLERSQKFLSQFGGLVGQQALLKERKQEVVLVLEFHRRQKPRVLLDHICPLAGIPFEIHFQPVADESDVPEHGGPVHLEFLLQRGAGDLFP